MCATVWEKGRKRVRATFLAFCSHFCFGRRDRNVTMEGGREERRIISEEERRRKRGAKDPGGKKCRENWTQGGSRKQS